MLTFLPETVIKAHEHADIATVATVLDGGEGWAAVVVGAVAAFFAYLQLRSLEKSARAEVIFRLDSAFETGDVLDSRQRIQTLKNAAIAQAKREILQETEVLELPENEQTDKLVRTKARAIFSDALDKLFAQYLTNDHEVLVMGDKDSSAELYSSFMRLPYWLETTAALNRQGLVTQRDILRFYDFVFDDMWSWFQGHITKRRENGNELFCRNFEDMSYQGRFHLDQAKRSILNRTWRGSIHSVTRLGKRLAYWIAR